MEEPIWRLSDLPERIRSGVEVDPSSGCWRFMHGKPANAHGHKKVWWKGEKQWVHRVVFTELVGPIPPNLELDHVRAWGCIWPDCLWPGHLEPVTHRENLLRAPTGVAAINAAKTACPASHLLVPGNLVPSLWRKGKRICLTCVREKDLARRPRRTVQREAKRRADEVPLRSHGRSEIWRRWQFGRAVLDNPAMTSGPSRRLREGVTGQLVEAAEQSGWPVTREEVRRFVYVAKVYPSEAQIRRVMAEFENWDQLRRAGFPSRDAG